MSNPKPIRPDIIPASGKRILSDVVISPKEKIETQIFREPTPKVTRPGRNFKNRILNWKFLAAAAVLFFLYIGLGFLFAKMEIVVEPKMFSAAVDQTIPLVKKTSSENELLYGNIAVADREAGTFESKETKSIEQKAKGRVLVFNKSGKNPQVLVASTRLEATGGKIYRIPKTVIVPGYKTENGKIIPGSKEVEVVADKPGADYNIGLVDFTIPGLKGSDKFDTIIARSKTEITGGASGTQNVVGQKEAGDGLQSLADAAKKNALNNILKKLPEDGFLIPPSLEYISSGENVNPKIGEAAQKFDIELLGQVRAAVVNKKDLAAILSKKVSLNNISPVVINNLDSLSFEMLNYKFSDSNFNLRIKGAANFQTAMNADSIKAGVIEGNLKDSGSILNAYPEIGKIEVRFSPFWWRQVPTNPNRIDIILK